MNELTNRTHVIVTRQMGIFYVDKDRAEKIVTLMNSNNPPRIFKIDESYIELAGITGVDTAARYEEQKRMKNGDWKCHSGNWHTKFEQCKCGWGMDTSNTKTLEDKPIAPEQAERGSVIRKLIRKKYPLKGISSKTTAELQEILASL